MILYSDEHFVAVDKPSGMLVHPTRIATDAREGTCVAILEKMLGRPVFPLHRIDRGTSGALLFALSPEAASRFNESLRAGALSKTYLAVARGHLPEEGVVDKPLRSSPEREALPALTRFRRLATAEVPIPVGKYPSARYSLADVRTDTGRMHQIRKHLAHLSHPIVGDTIYGDGRHNRLFREHFGLRRLLLLATELAFIHPFTGERIRVRAPLPADVAAVFAKLGWNAG